MNTNKNKRIYTNYNFFPCIRRLSNHRLYVRIKDIVDDYIKEGYKLSPISFDEIRQRDNYEDKNVNAWNERKSWKRNSKRKHQWKNK